MNRLHSQGLPIEVRVLHEASNENDSRAIAVQVFLDSKWNRIGYLVREVLESVHRAMHEDKIISAKLTRKDKNYISLAVSWLVLWNNDYKKRNVG